jgi:hypothetical protein
MSGNVIKNQILSLFRTEEPKQKPAQRHRRDVSSKTQQHGGSAKPKLRRHLNLTDDNTLFAQNAAGQAQPEKRRMAHSSEVEAKEGRRRSQNSRHGNKVHRQQATPSNVDAFEGSDVPSSVSRPSSVEAVVGGRNIASHLPASVHTVPMPPKQAAPSAPESVKARLEREAAAAAFSAEMGIIELGTWQKLTPYVALDGVDAQIFRAAVNLAHEANIDTSNLPGRLDVTAMRYAISRMLEDDEVCDILSEHMKLESEKTGLRKAELMRLERVKLELMELKRMTLEPTKLELLKLERMKCALSDDENSSGKGVDYTVINRVIDSSLRSDPLPRSRALGRATHLPMETASPPRSSANDAPHWVRDKPQRIDRWLDLVTVERMSHDAYRDHETVQQAAILREQAPRGT